MTVKTINLAVDNGTEQAYEVTEYFENEFKAAVLLPEYGYRVVVNPENIVDMKTSQDLARQFGLQVDDDPDNEWTIGNAPDGFWQACPVGTKAACLVWDEYAQTHIYWYNK